MAGTAVFFGIECARCRERVPLVEVVSVPPVNGGWLMPELDPFMVRCGLCGHERRYRRDSGSYSLVQSRKGNWSRTGASDRFSAPRFQLCVPIWELSTDDLARLHATSR